MSGNSMQSIVLRNGETLSGKVMLLSKAAYVVQTDDVCLRLSWQDITSVDGITDLRGMEASMGEEIAQASYFHDAYEDGSGTILESTTEINHGTKPIRARTFKLGSQKPELKEALRPVLDKFEYRDKWGNLLPVNVDEETNEGWIYRVNLEVPVFPGDLIELVHKAIWPKWGRQEGDGWIWSHYLRPSVGTLTSVWIRLPQGATYTRLEPEPLWKMEVRGQEIAHWRRFVPADEIFSPIVRYRLKDGV